MSLPLGFRWALLILASSSLIVGQQISVGADGQQPEAENPPVIERFPNINNHVIELKSERFTLDCRALGSPDPEFFWFKDDTPLANDTIEGLNLSGDQNQVLEFNKPSPELQGYYHCEAFNHLGKSKSEVILVTESVPRFPDYANAPEFAENPEVEIKEQGATVTFRCSGKNESGQDDPDITWTKNGEILTDYQNQKVLTIEKIDTSNIATYACNISNEFGYVYKIVYLNILTQAPIFTEVSPNATVSIGQEFILRCAARGYPTPNIRWTFNGKPAQDDPELSVLQSGELSIKRIVAEHGENPFVCIADNIHGTSNETIYLNVVTKTTIIKGPADTTAQVFTSHKMACDVYWDMSMELTVTWKKNNVDLKPDGINMVRGEDKSLTINNLDLKDSGTYTCVATTRTATATDSGTLKVVGIPPKVLMGPTEMTIVEGKDIEILCKVEGYPKPTNTWFKNTNRVEYSDPRFQMTSEGTLKILEVTVNDTAKYVCKAANDFGEVVASAFVDVRTRTKVLKGPEPALFQNGGEVLFDCLVDVDSALNDKVVVNWYKNDKKIEGIKLVTSDSDFNMTSMVTLPPFEEFFPVTTMASVDASSQDDSKFRLFANNSLLIYPVVAEDIGDYKCQVNSGVDDVVLMASIYTKESWLLLIIVLIIIICILLFIILTCIWYIRHKNKRQGRYGVKDVENGKKLNKTDITYSMDDEVEEKECSLLNPDKTLPTPIYAPKTLKGLSEATKGSENSLLNLTDEDQWLGRGMDEDGSFRGGYLE